MENSQDRFILNRLCEFRSRDVESEYMEFEKRTSTNTARFLVLFMGFSFSLFSFSDYGFHKLGNAFWLSFALRLSAFFLGLIAFFLIKKISRYDHTLTLITITELLVFAIYLAILSIRKGRDLPLQFMTLMLFILTVFLIPNRWKNCLAAGGIIWAGYFVYSIFFTDLSGPPSLAQRGIYLAICLVFCAIFIYGREKSRRRQFAAEKLLEFVSMTDRMTGIYNRCRFEFVLGQWIKNMRHDPFCLLLFDIDDFKKVNDRFGHTTGDKVLIETVKIISARIRDEEIFARWGGEEFVILFSGIKIDRAADLAERLRQAVEHNSFTVAGQVTISIGVVQYRRGETGFDLVNRADAKMYEAKRAGKNRIAAEMPQD